MVNELLINLTNSVLGVGKRTARGNVAYSCPFCNHHKKKLEINFTIGKKGENKWACWVCGKKGKSLKSLFKQVNPTPEQYKELYSLIGEESEIIIQKQEETKLPEEYRTILNNPNIIARHALTYLKSRGLTENDIEKYNVGYCEHGKYSNMIIIPSYDEKGKLNYFTGRSFQKDSFKKYQNPEISRDIIPFELFINWNVPIILCEGPFDAIAIKRNAIPLFGKNIQSNLMKKIVTSSVQKIYIALDKDAMKQSIKFAEEFINEGKEVYLVELNGKDPSSMGFEHFTKLIQNTQPLTQYNLLKTKLSLV